MFKFRRYKKTEGGKNKKGKHPKLIVDKKGNEFGFLGLTESNKRGHHKNIKIRNPQDHNSYSYLRDELRYDDSKNFGKPLPDYILHPSDYDKVIAVVNKKKKKK